MMTKMLIPILIAAIPLSSRPATADEMETAAKPAPSRRIDLAEIRLPWTEPAGRGPSIGYNFGLWGGENGQAVHLRMPLGMRTPTKFWGIDLRGIYIREHIHDFTNNEIDSEGYFCLRLGAYGQTPVFLNLFRVFGGGGVIYAKRNGDHDVPNWIGTGGFGIEFFVWRSISYYLQMEGHSPLLVQEDNHITLVAGMQLYPFSF